MMADSSRLDPLRDSVLSKIKSKDKRENRIHNHRRLFLTLLYMGELGTYHNREQSNLR